MRTVALIVSLLVALPAIANSVRIVSWNINNLHHTEGEGIPDRTNMPIRTRADYERIRDVLGSPTLDGDIIAFQETNGPEAVRKVLPGNAADWTICHESRFDRDQAGNFSPATRPDRIYTAVAVRRAAFPDVRCSPKGSTGPCWPGENPVFRQPIDFFVFNEDMWPRVVKDAQGRPDFHKLGLATFAPDLPTSQRNKLSDHCPIRTTLDLPTGAAPDPASGTQDGFIAALDALDRARTALCAAARAQLPSMPGQLLERCGRP